jgi:beta-lactamase regulating signal transducer with metallopeptidase domain
MNHVWQSSAFAILAALLALALRRSPANVRCWIWLSASLKFLLPVTLLVSLGTLLPHPAPRVVPAITPTVLEFTQPFNSDVYSPARSQNEVNWIAILWVLGFFAVVLARGRSWLRITRALRTATPVELPIPIRAVVAQHATEPGVVGFLRPVLVLPPTLLDHLNPKQLSAVLAHEMCHVRRRDNLFAAVHMLVEAIFWFNPLVWWIGSRLVEERERACDEEVLRTGCEPADYVEGILQVCRLYRESPLPCVSGVTGADVKKRLRTILSGTIARDWTAKQKIALATAGFAALAVPVMIGAATPRFEAESKIQSIYDLVVAENGPKLKPPSQGPKPPLPRGRVGRYRPHETMASLAAYLTAFTKTFVHDSTGLDGEYETSLSWVQDDDHGLADALQDQLGLKLVPTKGSVDFLIVDHAEKFPTQN